MVGGRHEASGGAAQPTLLTTQMVSDYPLPIGQHAAEDPEVHKHHLHHPALCQRPESRQAPPLSFC